MPARRETNPTETRTRRPPATTPQARENQLISAAVDLAEEQIRTGTASAQVITHFLKLGSSREKLEQLRLEGEVSVLQAKKEIMQSAKKIEELYEGAIVAMSRYQGQDPSPKDDDEYEG